MDPRVTPVDQFAVEPNEAVAVVTRAHVHPLAPLTAGTGLSGETIRVKCVNMADITPVASPQFLREAEIRRGIELLYFGYGNMIKGADVRLAETGLGRAHHRALYFIARRPGMPVSDLLRLLNITKQSLSRVLGELQADGYVAQEVGKRDRRQRLLRLTPKGVELEAMLFERLRERMTAAYAQAGQQAVTGFWAVLLGLIPSADRPMIQELQATLR